MEQILKSIENNVNDNFEKEKSFCVLCMMMIMYDINVYNAYSAMSSMMMIMVEWSLQNFVADQSK